MSCEIQLVASNKVPEMNKESTPVPSDEEPELMNPESTDMGSTADIKSIRKLQQEPETKDPTTSNGSAPPDHRNLPCGDPLEGNRDQYKRICAPLFYASITGDWEAAQVIFHKHQHLDLLDYAIRENYDTAFHIATFAKSSPSVDNFVKNLEDKMTKGQLQLTNVDDNIALCLEVADGHVKTVTTLLERYPDPVNIPGRNKMRPLSMACLFEKSEMVNYLYEKSMKMSSEYGWTDESRSWVLHKCIEANHFDVASKIVSQCSQLETIEIVLGLLASKKDAFKGTKAHFLRRFLRPILKVIKVKVDTSEKPSDAMKLLRQILNLHKDGIIKPTTNRKGKEKEVEFIGPRPIDKPTTSRMEKEDAQLLPINGHQNCTETIHESMFLFVAAERGNTKFLIEIFSRYPDLIWKRNNNDQTIFHVAVINRHEGIYNLLHEIGAMKDMITHMEDKDGNNMLHLVGKCVKNNYLKNDSGVGLQMHRELLWFKEVEAMIPPLYRERKNTNGVTPDQLFIEEHKDLLSKHERLMKDTEKQCLVVGALIAATSFGAAFEVPGGYNQNSGIPMFSHNKSFIAFVILDALSLISSSISIFIFLSIYVSRFAERDFLISLPDKLMTGVVFLYTSIAIMLVSFSVSFFVVYLDKFIWVPVIIAIYIYMPVGLYANLPYGIWDVYQSIRGSHLFRTKTHRLFYPSPSF